MAVATILFRRIVPLVVDAGPHGCQLTTSEFWILGGRVPVTVREQCVAVRPMKDDGRSISPPIRHIPTILVTSKP